MEKLLNMIREADNLSFLGNSSLSQVEQAEKELEVDFADDYKAYVLAFGAASFNGRELTGICNSDRLCVISATKRARELYPQFPKSKYVIEEMQFDHILTLQDSTGAVFTYGPADEEKWIAASLEDYLFSNRI